MTSTNEITASQWLKVRDRVADEVSNGTSPQTQRATKVNVAEALLRNDFVNIARVLEVIEDEKPKPYVPPVADKTIRATEPAKS